MLLNNFDFIFLSVAYIVSCHHVFNYSDIFIFLLMYNPLIVISYLFHYFCHIYLISLNCSVKLVVTCRCKIKLKVY